MKTINLFSIVATFISIASVVLVGCKKEEPVPAASAVSETAPVVDPSAKPAPPLAEDTRPVNSRVAEAEAALKAKDYERAAAAVTAPRQADVPITGEELMSLNKAQGEVINQLAAAAAAGDPKAKAAYEKMRQRALYRR